MSAAYGEEKLYEIGEKPKHNENKEENEAFMKNKNLFGRRNYRVKITQNVNEMVRNCE